MKQELERLLLQKEEFLVEGTLNKNKLAELARQYNPQLLNLLISEPTISNHFFSTLEKGVLVFKKDTFLQFLNNKEFLPDSFTAYKTKIGLATSDNRYLSENNEVVLNFPYKDCVLEGGQTKDDAKRQEIFFNETLAPTEINRLLDDKVLTNFKRFDSDGEQEVTEINETDNLIIKGNNLIALHSLKKRFAGKVKLIYIDVPYNTGSDSFGYNDNFNHSTWLTFMRNRLQVARELLSKEGVIFVHLDNNEVKYLGVLLDEIFGRNNFVELVTVVNNPRGRDYGGIANMHEFIFVYRKSEFAELFPINEPDKVFKFQDEYGGFDIRELRNRNTAFHIGNRPNLVYPIYVNPNSCDNSGFYSVSEVRDSEHTIEVLPKKSRGIQTVWRWGKPKFIENKNINVMARPMKDGGWSIQEKYRKRTVMARSVWWDKEVNSEKGTIHIGDLFGDKVFTFPKPEGTIKRILEIATKEGDIVLDYHLGSGTTAAVAHKMNRQYIGIEQMNYIETVSVERLKKVIDGEQGGISKDVNWTGGGSFVYAELKNDAQDFKEAILKATTTEELLELFNKAKTSSFLSYRVDPKKLKESEFKELSLAEQKQVLAEIVDNNNLYVNFSDMEDQTYGISPQEKALNRAFYGEE
ncbi:TPA: DNA methyltransferase [Streptococcus suis]|uniref:Putative type III restriction/modification system modification methylase n=1 Tax=Streptococcus suis TaxID=1307 RepID=A0A0Z8NCX1_STRSU|nr:site-specific DNA-methyltransferase [Streptococcus suis]MDW8742545.1 site-specific DNA-methyltransferase [Streptococcus suis]NQG45977.1 site-specific DNA-methyltransferase [Streptococcus suis]RRN52120.1 site-specific DNA-methyltransferase [Streptococcus suis]CYW25216.1 putative type III restriction/modification system modification methylase [Streptococcus suis]HEL1905994.1 site-specific DNA-methyltransferase [Streptococcus suis]